MVSSAKLTKSAIAFTGAALSLTFMRKLTPISAMVSFIGGGVTAILSGPMVSSIVIVILVDSMGVNLTSGAENDIENGVVFFTGVFGMSIMSGFFVVAQKFSAKPMKTAKEIKRLLKKKEEDNKR